MNPVDPGHSAMYRCPTLRPSLNAFVKSCLAPLNLLNLPLYQTIASSGCMVFMGGATSPRVQQQHHIKAGWGHCLHSVEFAGLHHH